MSFLVLFALLDCEHFLYHCVQYEAVFLFYSPPLSKVFLTVSFAALTAKYYLDTIIAL